MNQLLFDRSTGYLGPQSFARIFTTQALPLIQLEPKYRFDGGERPLTSNGNYTRLEDVEGIGRSAQIWAHQSGVNTVVVDQFDGRLYVAICDHGNIPTDIDASSLLSGGSDSSIKVWDLEAFSSETKVQTVKPLAGLSKTSSAHKYGITQLSFYPFDSAAFLSSSYDHTLKLYSTERLELSASFDLNSIVYTHTISPIASHLLVACATQYPAIRLVDLRSGASAHSLAGHRGALLSMSWSPTNEYILASGGTDGTARVWDVRKSSGTLGMLDMDDSIGVVGRVGGSRASSKAHNGAVNGLSWTDDGAYIITAGQDHRIRVWDAATGANTLANFGPIVKNEHLATISLVSSPTALTPPGKNLLFYPNEQEILMFELHEGRLSKRLKVPGPGTAAIHSRGGERNIRNRVTSLAWGVSTMGVFSGHSDGQIRVWAPNVGGEDGVDEDELERRRAGEEEEKNVKRKRDVLDEVYRDLTRTRITFG